MEKKMINADEIRRARTLLDAATPEWKVYERGHGTVWHEFEILSGYGRVLLRSMSYGNMENDTRLAVVARELLPRLLDEVEELQGKLAGTEKALEEMRKK